MNKYIIVQWRVSNSFNVYDELTFVIANVVFIRNSFIHLVTNYIYFTKELISGEINP